MEYSKLFSEGRRYWALLSIAAVVVALLMASYVVTDYFAWQGVSDINVMDFNEDVEGNAALTVYRPPDFFWFITFVCALIFIASFTAAFMSKAKEEEGEKKLNEKIALVRELKEKGTLGDRYAKKEKKEEPENPEEKDGTNSLPRPAPVPKPQPALESKPIAESVPNPTFEPVPKPKPEVSEAMEGVWEDGLLKMVETEPGEEKPAKVSMPAEPKPKQFPKAKLTIGPRPLEVSELKKQLVSRPRPVAPAPKPAPSQPEVPKPKEQAPKPGVMDEEIEKIKKELKKQLEEDG